MANENKIKNRLLILFLIFRVIIIILIVFYLTGITYHLITNSYVYEENGIRYCIYKESQTADVIKSPKANGKVVVPSYVTRNNKKYTVLTIKKNAFLDNNNIVELVFSEGIKKIEDESLSTNISKISIPNSIESFQVRNINTKNITTFNNCKYLGNDENPYVVLVKADNNIETSIIPEGLKVIAPYAFYECGSLTSIVLPDSVTSIERYTFTRCTSLNNLDISEDSNLKHIGEESLIGCANLKSLFIPKNCTDADILYSYLGNSNRTYVSKLEKIVVHNENPIYDSRDDCNAVIKTKTNELILGCKNTVIPASIKKLGFKCFAGVAFNDTELVLPNTVKEIGHYAFSMTNATKIVLNDSCEKLGWGVFSMCSNLEELIINKSIKEIGYRICEGDTKLKKLVLPFIGEKFSSNGQLSYFFGLSKERDFTNLSIYIRPEKKYVIYKKSIDMSINEIYFLENVYEIKSKAFNIQKINNIYISTSVTKVGKNIMNDYYSVSNSTIYIEALNLGEKWNINWNNIKNAKLEYGYSFKQIYQELEVQNEE